MPMAPAPAAFHVMSKPTGAICNLDCEYCFFLSKDQLYPGSVFRMEAHVHEAYISQLLAAHSGADEVVVAFQGGEPTLMGLDFFRRTLELEENLRQPGQRILNTMQSNATLLDDEWAAFMREHEFLVGVSIDGPRELRGQHLAQQIRRGRGQLLVQESGGVDTGVRGHRDVSFRSTVEGLPKDHAMTASMRLRHARHRARRTPLCWTQLRWPRLPMGDVAADGDASR